MSDESGDAESADAVKAGAEQFQQAALDALAAARAMIDAAESIVKEPGAVESLVVTITDLARTGTEAVSKMAADAGFGRPSTQAPRRSADVPDPGGDGAPAPRDDDVADGGFESIDLS